MKLAIINHPLSLLFIVSLAACQSPSVKKVENLAPNAHQVVAEEVIQTSRYTYVLVAADDKEYWVAIPRAEIMEGETYFWSVGSEMNHFKSTELNRTFPSIFFVQDFTDLPILSGSEQSPLMVTGKQQPLEKKGIHIEPAEGGITIAELFANRRDHAGKPVRVKGEVVKFLSGIMGRNWVHLQDGTRNGENFDLTVTTDLFVNAGDVVIFEGVVAVDKDFGAGYFYPVILEDAVIK